nr:glycosyl hydrolase [Auraticoccus cholistanensis]
MLPSQDEGSFRSVVAGEHDRVYRKVAQDLLDRGRGTSVVRIGWEANGAWFPWNATAQDAVEYRAAFRHVVRVLWSVAPDLVIDFDVACGTTLRGQDSRTDTLELLYPGDDVVDVVGCDTFDWYHTVTVDDASWAATQRPADAVGIADVADFARAHGKGMTVPEWGLASPQEQGRGDNPLLMQRMRGFFEDNADVLVLESYFNEPDTSLANSIWDPVQHPRASQVYADLW